MASVNKVLLVGNLGRDPEVRFDQAGNKVVTLSIATSEVWRDKSSGEMKERTEWHRVVIFNSHYCDVCEKMLRKGGRVYVEGQLQTRKWVDAQGQENKAREIIIRFKGEVVVLSNTNANNSISDRPAYSGGSNRPDQPEHSEPSSAQECPVASSIDGFDDEIPF